MTRSHIKPTQPTQSITQKNAGYRDRYPVIIFSLLITISLVLILVIVLLYQLAHRPLPVFYANTQDAKQFTLTANTEPNLLSTTLLKWASKAAVSAYTFDFANYNTEIQAARPYFTEDGWEDYLSSVSQLVQTILTNKLFVYGVVSGPPIISNQGELFGEGYAWRVQIPFLVIYQGADTSARNSYTVLMTIVKVPTSQNPVGIGIDQFVMA